MAVNTEKARQASMRNWDLKIIAAFRANLGKMEDVFPLGKQNFIDIRAELDKLELKIREYNAADEQMRLKLDEGS